MATASMVKTETLLITIDKVNRSLHTVVIPGSTDFVTFQANEDCEIHFDNSKVFGRDLLALNRGVPVELPVKQLNQQTGFEVYLSDDAGMTLVAQVPQPQMLVKTGPWPILP